MAEAIYIYGLRCPLTQAIRYIGKSDNPHKRFSNGHLANARLGKQHHTARWIRKLQRLELLPELVILEQVPHGQRWQEVERRWIAMALAKGWPLTNMTAGGEGLDYIDPAADAVYRKNLSRAMKELWNLPERREEARLRSLAAWANPEITIRRIASFVEAQNRAETKAKQAVAKAEVNARPEVNAARSEAMKNAWQTEEYQATIAAARNDPKFTAEQAKRLEDRWQDPGHREKMMASRWSEEKRAEHAKRVLDPERQAKIQAAKMRPEARAAKSAEVKAWWARRKAEAATAKAAKITQDA